ncbi:MAG: energy-coupling factor transporter ATPase [Clostridia bacterium]|nr:energy-coupling factor transporter ATPase [Clostridia bacterium]
MSIEVKNLRHIYDKGLPTEQVALDDVSFTIDDGKLVGIIGHTGSGKSTLLQHLNGLLKADSGNILIDGVDITDKDVTMLEIRKKIGLVFQYPEYQLFEETVEKDVAFGPKNLGLDEEEIAERVKEALTLVGLDYEKVKDKSPFDLSGGQKRRVAIAGVVAMRPRVLILDEPTAGLDPKSHQDILQMVKHIHATFGNIVIFVSHNMDDIANLSDQILVISDGKKIMDGTPLEVFGKRDELKAMGLSVPRVTELMARLKEKGLDVDQDILDISKAEEEIVRVLK